MYMGGCQNYASFLGTLNIRCRIRIGIQKGTIILTTAHIEGMKIFFCWLLEVDFDTPHLGEPSYFRLQGSRATAHYRVPNTKPGTLNPKIYDISS